MKLHHVAAAIASCLLAASPVFAKHLSVDFGPSGDGDDFGDATVGQPAGACTSTFTDPESCPINLLNNASSDAIGLGFSIDFGSGPVSSIYLNENGVVSFNGPVAATTSFSSLASLGQPVIAPFFADLSSVTFVGSVFEMSGTNFGQLMYQRGAATPLPDSDGTYDLTKEVPAFSMMWYGPTDASGSQVFAQVIIYSHPSSAPNDFDVRLLYGFDDTYQYNTGSGTTGVAGLLMGTNALNISGPLSAATDYFYSFRGGKLVGGSTSAPTVTCPTSSAQVGAAYSSAIGVSGGVSPYKFARSGPLPQGLSLDPSSGAISGTPSGAGPRTFTAKVVDSSGTASGTATASCTITVSPALPKLSVNPGSVSFGSVSQGATSSQTVTLMNNSSKDSVVFGKVSIKPGAGTDRLVFTAVNSCPTVLNPGQSCTIQVGFNASESGALSATLNFPNNAGGSVKSIQVSATVAP